MAFNQKAANRWVARFIPLILIGIVGYVTWVIVVLVCVDYLLRPPAFLYSARPGAAIAILVIYFVLLLMISSTYFRLLHTVIVNPGYISRGSRYFEQPNFESQRRRSRDPHKRSSSQLPELPQSSDTTTDSGSLENIPGNTCPPQSNPYPAGHLGRSRPETDQVTPGLEEFYSKDVFICEGDGRPIWCSKCMNWKPDRTHHCREVDRCVRKMDHFCPWVGGIVGEKNFKFFIQFTAWTCVYCTFMLVTMAVFISEVDKKIGRPNVHWAITLGFACLFWLFSFGMTASSVQFTILNTTSVENLSRSVKVYTLAVYMPRPPNPNIAPPFRTITHPLTASGSESNIPSSVSRTFAILYTKPGENPWDLGPLGNFKTVMGNNLFDWLFPLHYSPLCNHDNGESDFPLGPVVERLRVEAGIAMPREAIGEEKIKRRRHRHKHSQRQSPGDARHEVSEKSRDQRENRAEDERPPAEQGTEVEDRTVVR